MIALAIWFNRRGHDQAVGERGDEAQVFAARVDRAVDYLRRNPHRVPCLDCIVLAIDPDNTGAGQKGDNFFGVMGMGSMYRARAEPTAQ